MATKILPTEKVKRSLPKRGLIFALVGVVVVVALVLTGAMMARNSADQAEQAEKALHIGAGVTVGDLDLSGMTVEQAEAAIKQHYALLPQMQIPLSSADHQWTFTAAQLGVSIDAAATAKQAHAALSGDAVHAGDLKTDIPLVLKHDAAAVQQVIAPVAADVAVAPVDATLTIDANGVKLTSSKEGRTLDEATTLANLQAAVAKYPFGKADAVTTVVKPAVADADLADAAQTAATLSNEPVTLTLPNADGQTQRWILRPEDLRRMLLIKQDGGKTSVENKLNDELLATFVNSIAPQVAKEATDASLYLPDYATSVSMTVETTGQELDIPATEAAVQAAALAAGDARSIQPAIKVVPAGVTAAQLQPVKAKMDRILSEGITLTAGDKSYKIEAKDVVLKLYLQRSEGDSAEPYKPLVYDSDMALLARDAARSLDADAQNATYRLVNGAVTLSGQPQQGYEVDQEATAANIKQAFLDGTTSAALVGAPLMPKFTDTSLTQIATPDMLNEDSTYYGNSSPERNWNVTLGAERLDGWYIAPGEEFSVNEALGPLTLDAGFKMGWAILVSGGNASTIPSEAGGICQVVTTLFHPLFWTGVTFTERHHHSYWIEKYGHAPMGMQGLDATIDPPWSDLKFVNTTGNWLLIRAEGDKQNVHVSLWGTKTGWKVQVDGPVITNVVKTDTKMRYEQNDQLPAGKTVVVETAQDGFDVDIHRQVFDANGNKIDDWHASGTYLPAHNVTVTGTGKNVPTPTP